MAASLNLVPSQHLTLTPQMRQTLQVLQLSTLELSQKISNALEDNPLLEICESSEETFENIGMPKEMTRKNGKLRQKKHFPATSLNRPAACRSLKKIPDFYAGSSAASTMTDSFPKA